MQNEYLTVSTGTPGTPSGGVSPTPLETLSGQSLWTSLLVPGTSLERSYTDANLEGKLQFVTTVDITGAISRGAEELALLRLACIYIVGQLSGKALVDAYEALVDQYRWQVDQLMTLPTLSSSRRITVTNVRDEQRTPFIFNDE